MEKPQDVTCFEGYSATFVCFVSPTDLPHVQWCLDDSPLQPSPLNDIHILEGGGVRCHSLTVRELTPVTLAPSLWLLGIRQFMRPLLSKVTDTTCS